MDRAELLARFSDRIPVLDHGFVELIDVMGDDAAIDDAARVSYQAGTRKVSDRRTLLRYLMRARHTSPFEMAEIKLRVKLPIFVERQWIRHRTANVNETSARYSVLPEDFYVPVAQQVCYQDKKNRQGRAEPMPEADAEAFRGHQRLGGEAAFAEYNAALEAGVARETARIGLPLGTYTEKIWKIDVHNLLHFLALRLDAHAQWEVRQFAEAIATIVREWIPLTWEAFEDYRLHAYTLSRMEAEVVRRMVASFLSDEAEAASSDGRDIDPPQFIRDMCMPGMSKRETGEFVARFVEAPLPVSFQYATLATHEPRAKSHGDVLSDEITRHVGDGLADQAGLFIVIEGIDGSGKTTQAERLGAWFKEQGRTVVVTREPTDGPMGRRIRERQTRPAPEVELEQFIADRHEHIREVIRPALQRGEVVICDRYYWSNVVYQSLAGLSALWVYERNAFAIRPHLSVIILAGVGECLRRICVRAEATGRAHTAFEDPATLASAQRAYENIASGRLAEFGMGPRLTETIVAVDGSGTIEEVNQSIRRHVLVRFSVLP